MFKNIHTISTIINKTTKQIISKIPIISFQKQIPNNPYSFCTSKITQKSNPSNNNIPPQPITPLDKIFQQIDTLKNSEITNQNLEKIIKKIQSTPIPISDKNSVKKYLTALLFKKNYPQTQLLTNPLIHQIQKSQPFLQIQTIIYIINKQKTKININHNHINNLYLKCFNQIIPSSQGIEKLKCQVLIYKNFGKYLIDHNMKQKGIQMLEKSISKHKDLILQQYNRMENTANIFTKQSKTNQKTKQQKQKHQLQLNAMKQNIRRLMQSMFQVLYFFYQSKQNLIQNHNPNKTTKQQFLVSISFLIKQSMTMKSLVPKVQLYSRYYHKLMQIYYQLQYTYALTQKNQQKIKQIRKSMKQFQKQCIYEISQIIKQPQILKQIIIVIFNINLHLNRQKYYNNPQILKKQLSQCAYNIIQSAKMQHGSIEKQITTKLLAQFLKKNIH